MRAQQLLALSSFVLVSNIGVGLALEEKDIPSKCLDICRPVVDVTQKCEKDSAGNSELVPCMCGSSQASTLFPLCEACLSQDDDDNSKVRRRGNGDVRPDNEMHDILQVCSLPTTSYSPTAASSAVSAKPTSATMTATGTGSGIHSTNTADSKTLTGSANASSQTANVAAGVSAQKIASLAAFLGLMSFA